MIHYIIFKLARVLYLAIQTNVVFFCFFKIGETKQLFIQLFICFIVSLYLIICERFFCYFSNFIFFLIMTICPFLKQKISYEMWENKKDNDYKKQNKDRYIDCMSFFEKNIKKILRKDSNVADIGCGDGWFLREILPLVHSATGYDYSQTLLGKAKQNTKSFCNVQYELQNITESQLPQKYDIISFQGVCFCLIDKKNVSLAWKNVLLSLKPNGFIIYRDAFVIDSQYDLVLWNAGMIYRIKNFINTILTQEKLKIVASEKVGNPYKIKNNWIQNYIYLLKKD